MWVLVWLALSGAVASLRCPDGRLCWGQDTCCPGPRGDGYACCRPALGSLPMTQAGSVAKPAGIMCPNGRQCPLEYSCLRTSTGSFGCCPLAEAVACADGHHCCPRGAHCSTDGRSCFMLPGPPAAGAVQCPDGKSECPNESTCCMMPTGSWGCCPMPQAACCSDKVHCCPHATICDLAHARCLSAAGELPMGTKVPARRRAPLQGATAEDVRCDDKTSCPDGNTCCRLSSGGWGCCPLVEAVCCPDHEHCCPNGYTCDPAGGSCQPPGTSIPWLEKSPARVGAPSGERDVRCDDKTSCPDGSTCCRLSSGGWGCCPLVEAVCCPDHEHCCPNGYTCDPAGGSCQPPGTSIPWLEKTPARVGAPSGERDVRCDDETSCPDGSTCCRLSSGGWGCCPLVEAVCCPDHKHCCPKGYTCDPAGGSCQPPSTSIPWLEKTPARVGAPAGEQDVRCDDKTSCPDGNTCCRLSSGGWGCCPLVEAVCCPDHHHCCPKGYSCTPEGQCQPALFSLPWAPQAPTLLSHAHPHHTVPCNQSTSCEDRQTCCRSKTGTWACCNLPNAVCCADHQHCCPWGYTCNLAAQSCEKQDAARGLPGDLSPIASLLPADHEPSNNLACDAQHYCLRFQRCCKTPGGTWGCCPYFWGTCCADQRHCCPWLYRCADSGLSCVRRWRLPWDPPAPHPHPLL